jgi:hypothetical protein
MLVQELAQAQRQLAMNALEQLGEKIACQLIGKTAVGQLGDQTIVPYGVKLRFGAATAVEDAGGPPAIGHVEFIAAAKPRIHVQGLVKIAHQMDHPGQGYGLVIVALG